MRDRRRDGAEHSHRASVGLHGRDVFAPVAANLSKGLPLWKVGAPIQEFVKLSWPEPQRAANWIKGEIAYIDHFGNAITNIGNAALAPLVEGSHEIIVKSTQLCAIQRFYQAVPQGNPVAVPGSSGFLELAVNGGSAARKFKLKVGQTVVLRVRPNH